MAGRPRKHPKVRIEWEKRWDDEGRQYARLRWSKDGKRDGEKVGFATPEEAEEARADMEAALRLDVRLSDESDDEPVTVEIVMADYLADLTPRASARALENEELRIAAVTRWLGHYRADTLTTTHLRRYASWRKGETWERKRDGATRSPSRSTIVQEIKLLRRAYRVARDLGAIDYPPPRMPNLKALPDDARPPRRLTEIEVARLIAAASTWHAWFGRLVQFLAWCPRRPVAVFSMQRQDTDRALAEHLPRAQRLAHFRRDKGGVGRGWCPLTEPAEQALREQIAATDGGPDDLVWTSVTGLKLYPALIQPRLKWAAKEAGVEDFQLYDLRKFGASRVYKVTGNIRETQVYTGHADPATLLNNYVFAEREAAEKLAPSITWTPEPLRLVEDGDDA